MSESSNEQGTPSGAERAWRAGAAVSASLVTFVILVAFALRAEGVTTADTWFNLRFGQRIVREGLPRFNDDTLLAMGAPWVDLQWLAHAAWYGIYTAAGIAGIVLVRAALMTWVLTGALWSERRLTLRPALIAFLACIVAIPFGAARAQSFAEVLFVTVLAVVARPPSRRRSALVLLLAVVWANVHGSAPLASVLVGWHLVVRGRRWERKAIVAELLLAALCAGALFLTPYGVHTLSHYRGTLANPLLRARVLEWSIATPKLTPWYFAVVAVVVPIVVRGRAWRRDPFGVGLGLAFVALGFWSVRHQIWFAVVIARFGAGWLDDALGTERLRFAVRGDRWARPLPMVGALLVIAGALGARRSAARDGFADTARVLVEASARGEKLYVDLAYVDRALLVEHALRAKVPYDIRFELWKLPDFVAHYRRPRDRSSRGLQRWEQFDVIFLEQADESAPTTRALAASGRWQTLRFGPLGTLLRRAALPADTSRAWSVKLSVQ